MKRLLYLNFKVGSGIEYVGNLFYNILKDKFTVHNYQLQNPSCIIIDEIVKFEPEIIILNEVYRRSMEAAYFYKRMKPQTKVIQICHDWCKIFEAYENNRMENDIKVLHQHFFNKIDTIFLLNFKKNHLKWPSKFEAKNIVQGYFPSEEKYKITKPWDERKDICYIGSIEPLRLSEKFLQNLKMYPEIKIDCYGRKVETINEKYYNLFDSVDNISYKEILEQDQVADKLNEYKYFILAHEDAGEVFFLILLQAIMCGTIPLISYNSIINNRLDSNWLDWANGFYFGCENEIDLLENTRKILKEKPDLKETSIQISENIRKKFSIDKLRKLFLSITL